MKRATQLCLILGVALQVAEFSYSVRELAFVTIFANTGFFKGPTQFGLVSAGGRWWRCRFACGTLEPPMAEAIEETDEGTVCRH